MEKLPVSGRCLSILGKKMQAAILNFMSRNDPFYLQARSIG